LNMRFANIFSQSVAYLYILLPPTFIEQKFLILFIILKISWIVLFWCCI
jgi:hypothetical protein